MFIYTKFDIRIIKCVLKIQLWSFTTTPSVKLDHDFSLFTDKDTHFWTRFGCRNLYLHFVVFLSAVKAFDNNIYHLLSQTDNILSTEKICIQKLHLINSQHRNCQQNQKVTERHTNNLYICNKFQKNKTLKENTQLCLSSSKC